MVVDTSALIAIVLGEAERISFRETILASPARIMSTPNYLEAVIVTTRRLGAAQLPALSALVAALEIRLEPFTQGHLAAAQDAFLRYGKGRHPAALNFGDCIAYAVAKTTNMPLLHKGTDFALTDVTEAG